MQRRCNAFGVVFCLRQNWIATIFSAKKSRNDTRFFIFTVVERHLLGNVIS